MQVTNATYDALLTSGAKDLEFIVAIAGWPTLYSVSATGYTLATVTATSDALAQFTGIQKLAQVPTGGSVSCKGRPEEGGQTIATVTVSLLDKMVSGKRTISDLISRASYVLSPAANSETTLSGAITSTATSITLSSATGFADGSVCYIGQECILLGTGGPNFINCTRGYRLTTATSHATGVTVYNFMPNLQRRAIFIYKGFQSMTSTATFLRDFGGVITGEGKDENYVHLTASPYTWELYAQGTRKLATVYDTVTGTALGSITGTGATTTLLSGDFQMDVNTSVTAAQLGDGHHMMKIGNCWFGITAAINSPLNGVGGTIRRLTLITGLGATQQPDYIGTLNQPVTFGWSNLDFTVSPPVGDEPLTLLRRFLMSIKGDGANGAFDTLALGIGLGIPAALIDLTSFTAISSAADYDTNQRVFFNFVEPVSAKEFIETELCKPFGWSLITGNDGRIKIIQHRNPQSFHIAGVNNLLAVSLNGGPTYTTTMTSGAYTPDAMATEIARALNAIGSGFSCSYSMSTNQFTISNATTFRLLSPSPSSHSAWVTLGWSSLGIAGTSNTAPTAKAFAPLSTDTPTAIAAAGSGISGVLSENDVMDLAQMNTRDTQIAQVAYWANYDWETGKYRAQRVYIDAETVNLGDSLGAREYVVKSKGLLQSGRWNPWNHRRDSSANGSCDGVFVSLSDTFSHDLPGSWWELYSLSLLHRYKQPPIGLKAKLLWKWNHLEMGDVIKLNYSLDGVIADTERDTTTLSKRNFEIVKIAPDRKGGYVEVELIGHRYQGAI